MAHAIFRPLKGGADADGDTDSRENTGNGPFVQDRFKETRYPMSVGRDVENVKRQKSPSMYRGKRQVDRLVLLSIYDSIPAVCYAPCGAREA